MCQVWVLEQQMGQTENLLKSCLCGKFFKSKCSYIMERVASGSAFNVLQLDTLWFE